MRGENIVRSVFVLNLGPRVPDGEPQLAVPQKLKFGRLAN